LDPLATGLLLLLVGRQYTKLQPVFLKQDKEYFCTAQLGVTTDSFDSDGTVSSKADWSQLKNIEQKDVVAVLEKFRGEQQQTVPSYSAVKIKGQKLYNLARKSAGGSEDLLKDIELPIRTVQVKELFLECFEKDEKLQHIFITFRTFVSSGTYIRSLAHDVGQQLGVGATVTALRRTKIGQIKIEKALSLEQI
jgi:tRNA pseudouridine55 synthase